MLKKTLRKLCIAVIGVLIISSLSSVNSFADEVSQNQQLALYYATLAQQGGNDSVSKEEAVNLANYYASLAAGGASAAPASAQNPAQGATSGTACNAVNVNASGDFYLKTNARLNALPEIIKQRLASHNVQIKLYDRSENFGCAYSIGGITNTTYTYGGSSGRRSVTSVINLAEHTSIYTNSKATPEFVIYHEVGHFLDMVVWEKSGQRACDSQALQNAVTLEYKKIRSISGYNNPDNHFDEYFADAIA